MAAAEQNTDMTGGQFRRLYSGYLTGKRINSVSMSAEAWFWRLHSIADDCGNLMGDPKLLCSLAAPRRDITPKQAREWTEELVTAKLIYRYASDEDTYIHIIGFEQKQIASSRNGKRIQKFPTHPDNTLEINEGAIRKSQTIQEIPSKSGKLEDGQDADTKIPSQHNHNQYQDHNQNQNHNQEHPPQPPKGGGACEEWESVVSQLPETFHTPQFQAVWKEWTGFRREIKKKLAPSTVKEQLKTLVEFGHDNAIESIRRSIQNGWQGLFAPENRAGGGRARTPSRSWDKDYPEPERPLPALG